VLAASVASLAVVVHGRAATASPLLVAIVLGAVAANTRVLPAATGPGLAWSGRYLLRAGIVLLGLQLSLTDVAGLGPAVVGVAVAVVAGGVAVTMALGRLLGLGWSQRLLIACGFSICGAAAVAAVDAVLHDGDRGGSPGRKESAASAIGLVVLFGTLMIGVVPAVAGMLGLPPRAAGVWAGASVHEVAQVVAVGGLLGQGALGVAVVVKLARVLLLGPVVAWVGWRLRVQARSGASTYGGGRTPLVPGFVLGFCVAVVLTTWVPVPRPVLVAAAGTQTWLLAAAMFALGCGVRLAALRRLGAAPLVLATAATVWVAATGLVGAVLTR
jgi:uncharacterized integral membrane protein (TIGR00698 family)